MFVLRVGTRKEGYGLFVEEIFAANNSVLFLVSLFFALMETPEISSRLRVTLIYALAYLAFLFGYVGFSSSLTTITVVSFIMLEICNSDQKLVKLFSVKYKFVDFIYRMIFEYYILQVIGFIYVTQFFLKIKTISVGYLQPIVCIVFLGLMLIVSRGKFETKSISEMIKLLTESTSLGDSSQFLSCKKKYELLARLEDKDFFNRNERQHTIPVKVVFLRLCRYVLSRKRFNFSKFQTRYVRGHSTIEMQLIRSVGIEFGSYQFSIRRKVFECLYSNMVLNSYINQFDKGSTERKNFRYWIAQSYINNVGVKYGIKKIYPKMDSSFCKIFGKKISEGSMEEFFVWCLGLRWYENGVGEKAIEMNAGIIEEFGLDKKVINHAAQIAMICDY